MQIKELAVLGLHRLAEPLPKIDSKSFGPSILRYQRSVGDCRQLGGYMKLDEVDRLSRKDAYELSKGKVPYCSVIWSRINSGYNLKTIRYRFLSGS